MNGDRTGDIAAVVRVEVTLCIEASPTLIPCGFHILPDIIPFTDNVDLFYTIRICELDIKGHLTIGENDDRTCTHVGQVIFRSVINHREVRQLRERRGVLYVCRRYQLEIVLAHGRCGNGIGRIVLRVRNGDFRGIFPVSSRIGTAQLSVPNAELNFRHWNCQTGNRERAGPDGLRYVDGQDRKRLVDNTHRFPVCLPVHPVTDTGITGYRQLRIRFDGIADSSSLDGRREAEFVFAVDIVLNKQGANF